MLPALVIYISETKHNLLLNFAAGKSAVAVELAKLLDGEVINADSVQLYRGLDIASARITPSEMADIPHHLLGCCSPGECVTASDYRDSALSLITDIKKRRKIPIIVGGTNYYIERVLFGEDRLEQAQSIEPLTESAEAGEKDAAVSLDRDDEQLWSALKRLNADSASLIHPNDSRRVKKALNCLKNTVA